ncbi:MAG: hypothetical protein LBV07_03320 [Syntrophobacterales bacterium]|jgi:hypothetical protein|nr:hypothetical protein [Syntrophobacterales bacterium]
MALQNHTFGYCPKNKQTKLTPTDFVISESGENEFSIVGSNVVIFNKAVENDKIGICIYGPHKFEDYASKIIGYIYWLSGCKSELKNFYNAEMSEYTEEKANDDWYDTLEIFSVKIIVGMNGSLYSEISCGDNISQYHILDIETENETITSMNYDG